MSTDAHDDVIRAFDQPSPACQRRGGAVSGASGRTLTGRRRWSALGWGNNDDLRIRARWPPAREHLYERLALRRPTSGGSSVPTSWPPSNGSSSSSASSARRSLSCNVTTACSEPTLRNGTPGELGSIVSSRHALWHEAERLAVRFGLTAIPYERKEGPWSRTRQFALVTCFIPHRRLLLPAGDDGRRGAGRFSPATVPLSTARSRASRAAIPPALDAADSG